MMQFLTGHIFDAAPGEPEERILLLMLPGAKNTPQQLVDNGFIRALRERGLPVDVLALDAHADLYLEHAGIERVLHHTLDEVRAQGYRRIWLLGISLGGSGAMFCVTQRRAEIEGVFLLAPFLGTRGIIAEVMAAGGLRHWQAGVIHERDHERTLLDRIRGSIADPQGLPTILLGYGSEDHYRSASDMLTAHLPPEQVTLRPGGHDWETWNLLWRELLDKQALSR